MIIKFDGRPYSMSCMPCRESLEVFNSNDDLRCPSCKIVVSQAGIGSAFEEYLTYLAASEVTAKLKTIKGFKPQKLKAPQFQFVTQD